MGAGTVPVAGHLLSGPSSKANSTRNTHPGPTHCPTPNSRALEQSVPDGLAPELCPHLTVGDRPPRA